MNDFYMEMLQYLNPTEEYNKVVTFMTNGELDEYIEKHNLEQPKYSGYLRLKHKCYIVTKHMRGDK